MPAKRRPATAAAAAPKPTEKKTRQSKLAKENNISGEEEAEIREAWNLFSVPHEDYEGEKEGVIPVEEVRRALIALGLPPTNKDEMREIIETLDPTDVGFATYPSFVTICALKLRTRDDADLSEEVETAFRLFTHGAEGPISLAHLRRVARELREEVSDDVLRDMILEANGGEGVHRGVRLEDFEAVMRRAGVF
ncbi:EF-hand superfamily Ca2+-modulated protein [Xylona heveae TC161]|uniref:Calmodulin n=1 Tax=Xylona heveae (strain CBS 132557 / TC161) TaxID=1328760 RepID=A0A165JU11_XYLHT|nr:EF-hand superfamily Ca2+-modulated protein [Xylona heveae TC161]KZF26627.1 EF-hand superfamily Ca2+-modulated protein [Xylona heveae TC161]